MPMPVMGTIVHVVYICLVHDIHLAYHVAERVYSLPCHLNIFVGRPETYIVVAWWTSNFKIVNTGVELYPRI